ncbi:MAG: hypothetical protein WAK96_04820 [Desulfobaccales bacterium]
MSLTALDSEDIAQVVLTVATPNAISGILRIHRDVEAVRQYLFDNAENSRRAIEEYVRERLIDLKQKTYFTHEPAFCALAVALETLPMPAAEDFLSELAALKIAEMPISSRVAALCLERRRELIIPYTLSVFKDKSMPIADAPLQNRPPRVRTKSTYLGRLPRVPTKTSYPNIFKAAA